MKTTLCLSLTLLTFVTLIFLPKSFAQNSRPVVRLIYFVPSDRSAQPNIDERMDKLIKEVQEVFAGQMEHYGFGRKTFQFETNATGRAVVHHVKGKFKDKYYHDQSWRVWEEIEKRFDTSTNIYLAALEAGTEAIDGFACGRGGTTDPYGGTVLIPASGWCFKESDVTVHELGHAFGLLHDFRNDLQPWIDLYSTEPMTTSACAAEWLDVHRYFNDHQIYSDEPTTIEMLPSEAVHSDSIRFEITDLNGLHQVQLFVTVKYLNGHDIGIFDCKSLAGSSNIVEFAPTPLVMMADAKPLQVITKSAVLRVIDARGNFTHHQFPIDVTHLMSRGEVVSIPDANLAAVVRETLGLAPRAPITQRDMLKLTSLEAPERQITDLTGLTHTKNLKSLNLAGNQIRDVTPLAGLLQLEFLDLRQNRISDIRPLMGVRRLRNLKFGDNPILDTAVQLQALRQNNPDLGSDADPKIEGPWLWMIVPTGQSTSLDASLWKDWLAAASNNSVTEEQIASNGAIVGGRVKNRVWTSGKLAPAGGNNIGEMVNTIGLGRGIINYHVAYGSIILKSPREQNTRMYAGSDDNHKVWLNGELVHEQLDWRWAHDYQGSFPVTLRQGKNVLLVAIQNVGGPWGGYFGFESGTAYSLTTPIVHIESAFPASYAPGQITFSELMFATTGDLFSQPQWIELYNNASIDTEAVNLRGSRLVIEARDSETRHRYSVIEFEDLHIAPNWTVLLVTGGNKRSSEHLTEDRVYDLDDHSNVVSLGLRDDAVLPASGFSLKLFAADGTLVDTAGNLDGVKRSKDIPAWELPLGWTEDRVRTSLIRRYEAGVALPGTEAMSWVRAADLPLAVNTYYGRETDVGTPGYRRDGPLPVVLSFFRSERTDAGIIIKWTTESEVDNAGFYIYRSETKDGEFKIVNPILIQGAGTTSERNTYTWKDTTAKPNVVYYYRIEDVSQAGVRKQLATMRMRGLVSASGKLTTRWANLKAQE